MGTTSRTQATAIAPARGFEKIFVRFALAIIMIAAGLMLYAISQIGKTTDEVKATSAYTRASNCIVAKSANPDFTQDEIERCYVQVEKNTGVSLERFDFQTNNENPSD